MKKKVFSLMMMLLLAVTGFVRADELTVHNGTYTNGYVPVYGYYADAYLKCEMVYPAAELSDMAGAQISALKFYASQTSVDWGDASFQVFLTEVANATISGFAGPGTVVYEGALSISGGEMLVNFTTPYQYNGGNLLVGVYNTVKGDYVSSTWTGESVTGASYQGYSYSSLSAVSGYQRNFLPKTTFTYTAGGGSMEEQLHVMYTEDGEEIVDRINMGTRPAGCWMEPLQVTMYSEGPVYTVNILDFTPSDGMFNVVRADGEELPYQVDQDGVELLMSTTESAPAGVIERQFVAITEGNRAAHVWPIVVEMYAPEVPDVWELAYDLGTIEPGFEYAGDPADITPTVLHDDYTLPFPEIEEGEDAVYKFTVESDVIINAYVDPNAPNGKVALYTEDFYGEGGPMATNNYTGLPGPGEGGSAGAPFEAQIGEGTSTSGYFPFYSLYNYSIAAELFTAAELSEAGVTTAPFTSLSWYATNSISQNQNGITIWMANVSDTEIPTASPLATGMTKVYTGSLEQPTPTGWVEFVFNEGSFSWDGNSNIMILCQRNNGSWTSSIQWQYDNAGFNARGYLYQDSAPYNVETTSYNWTRGTYRANIIMRGGGARSAEDGIVDFEDGDIPTDWTASTAPNGWYVSDSFDGDQCLAYAGEYSLYSEGNSEFDYDYFVSPVQHMNGGSISFAYVTPISSVSGGGEDPGEEGPRDADQNTLSVGYGFSVNGPWTWLMEDESSTDWTVETIDLSALVGTYYICFRSYDGGGLCTALDNIEINDGSVPAPALEGVSAGPVISNLPLTAGTYYLVSSASMNTVSGGGEDPGEEGLREDEVEGYMVYINCYPMPCPDIEAEGFAFSPQPADDEDEVEPASVTLRWMVPEYATGWRLIFGSTYYPDPNHPQTVMFPEDGSFSTQMANSYTVRNLWNNTNYFWHVEFNNSACPDGVSSPIWGFTTHLNVPQDLTVVDETVFNDEEIVLSWNAVVDRTYRFYNVYRDGVCIGHTDVNDISNTTYTDGPLAYNMDGYVYYVTAVYDEGESAPSNEVTVKVSGYGDVNGHVYEQDGTTGIAGATVTMVGQDEFGVNHTYNFTTNAQGYYTGHIYAGHAYDGQAAKEGYQTAYEPVQGEPIDVNYNATTSPIDYIMDENFDPVCGVIAEYYPDSLDPASPYVKVYWGCGLPGSEIIEPFETGDFSAFDWQLDPTYPWSITTNNPYEGEYCMKSGGAGVANVVSNMTVTVDIPNDGVMSFFAKISCENSWDYGYFYIDNVQKGSFTGAGNWVEKTYDITAGEHTFQWRYTKDSSVNSNDDCFYVDYITFYKQPEPAIPGMTYDFEDGTMQGWTSVDADGDGYGWYMGSEIMTGQTGNNGSTDFVLSQSYYMGSVLYPDNYLVSPQVQLGGIVRFYACAQDASYAAEHFGLAVSTTNTNPSSFTMVQEWTMTAKGDDGSKPVTRNTRSGRAQGTWYEYTVDLSAYSGMGYVAIRHFNCSDMFYLNVDDITIGEPGAKMAETRSLDHYRVYRTNCYNDGPYTEENTVLLATVWVPDTVYIDVEWADLDPGVYKWGVGSVYSGNRGELVEGPISWTAPQNVNRTSGTFASANGTTAGNHTGNASAVNRDGWLMYDDGENVDAIGLTSGGSFYWGVMFPGGTYTENQLTKVSMYDYSAHTGTIYVYQGGSDAPGTLVGQQAYTCTGSNDFVEWTMSTPITIDPSQNLWIVMNNSNGQYVASIADYCGDDNGEWISMDGTDWSDLYSATGGSLDGTWMIRAYVENAGGPTPGPTPGTNLNELALPRESETIWSNCLDKDMYLYGVTVNVLLNSADSPEGTTVDFTNLNEYEQMTYGGYNLTLDESGFYAFESFRRGEYAIEIELDGYETINDTVSIWSDTDLRYVMTEILYGVGNVYVSRTGWAMWDGTIDPNGGGNQGGGNYPTTFEFGFENGLEDWTTIDNDGDGLNWVNSVESVSASGYDYTGLAHGGNYFVYSQSYIDYVGAYDADNYLVSPQKYSITNGSTLSFWADNANDSYPDHFAVAIATVDNPTAADFVDVWNHSGAKSGEKASVRNQDGRYDNWRSHSVDLSAYAGQDVYIAFHHQDYDEYEIWIDDVTLTAGAKSDERHFEYYKVMCTSIDGVPIYNHNTVWPWCQLSTNEPYNAPLVEGEHYLCKVAVMYSTGMSEWSEPVEWEYEPCDHWGPVDEVTATTLSQGNHIEWVFEHGYNPYGGTIGGGGEASTFSVDFEGTSLPEGWNVIDGNNDGYTWCLTSAIPTTWTYYASLTLDWYHNGTNAICSGSYINGAGALTPDEYLVSPQVTLANGSQLSFWAAAADASYPADHFGVFVSDNGTSDWTSVQEWTLTAKKSGEVGGRASRDGNGNRLGNWHQYTVDLSAYAGQKYIAIRHFNCTDQYIMVVDDIELTAGAKGYNAMNSGMIGDVYAFNITDIANFDERVYFLYKLVNDGRFNVVQGEAAGMFIISANNANLDLEEAVNEFVYNNNIEFGQMDKVQAANTANAYKAALPAGFTNSLMMDMYIQSRENNLCELGDPFCTDEGMYEFPAGVNAGSGETGPDYDCLYTQPNPAWYYMKISDPGDMDIYMYSTPSVDIDFCCWGPFDDPFSPCPYGLTEDKVVSCSYSAQATEHCMIPASAQTGEYYILVITNYSNQPCNINFSKIGGSGTTDCTIVNPTYDLIGFLITLDGEYLAFVDPDAREYDDLGEYGDHEYCVRPIYPGEMILPDHNYGWSMGCPVCASTNGQQICEPGAPIHAEDLNATDQVKIWWGELPAAPIEDWLYYDDGENQDAIGLTNGGSFYWGIKFPAASMAAYEGCSVTKIGYFDYSAHTGTVRIYNGSNGNGPGTLIGTYNYTANGTEDWVEWDIPAVAFSNTQDLWIVMNNAGGQYVAAVGNYTGDPNGTMISTDGSSWYTLDDATGGALSGTWNLRCFVTNQAKGGEIVALEDKGHGTPDGVIANAGVAKHGSTPAFMNRSELVLYNVYRSDDNDDYELIGTVPAVAGQTYYEYIDTPEVAGTYYYQVTAEYSDGCESDAAPAFDLPTLDYVTGHVDGLNENDANVALYPNPTKGNVTIEAAGMSRITVVSVLGQVVYDTELNADTFTLNMTQFNAGMYMVRIYTENGVSVKRVTVMK